MGADTPLLNFLKRRWVPLLIALHVAKMAYWFHAVSFGGSLPLVNVDYIQFYGRALRMHEFLSRSGRIWGYDPYDMGGYLSGPFLEVGTHALALAAHALSHLIPVGVSLLVMEILGLSVAPFLLVLGARLLGATREQSWATFGLAIFLIGGVEQFSTGMYKLGLWGWMVSSFLALPQIGLLWRWLNGPTWKRWLAFVACWALGSMIHPSEFINVAVPAFAAYALTFRSLPVRRHLELYAAAAVAVAANWFWIHPFIAFSQWRVTAPYYDTAGLLDLFHRFGPLQVDFYSSVRAIIHVLVAALAICSLAGLREKNRPLFFLLATWLGWLALVCYFGSSLPWVSTLQPGRNEFPLWLLCYVLAGFSLGEVLLPSERAFRIALLLGTFALAYSFELTPDGSPWSKFAAPLTNRLPVWQDQLIEYLKENKPRDGRVLLECNDDLQPHFADVIPMMTGAMLIGGQHPGSFLAAKFTLFSGTYVIFQETRKDDPIAFGKNLRDMGEASFSQYLDLYNVRLVIARTPQTLQILSGFHAVLVPETSFPPHKVFRVAKPSTWFAEGSGEVAFDYDRITINHPSAGRLVLKSHWLSTFRSSPGVSLSPIYLMDDPVPFIAIDNAAGLSHIEIFNAGLPSVIDRLHGKFHDDWGRR